MHDDIDSLRTENDELRRRLAAVEAELTALRAESRQRTDEVRALVRDVPAAVSRRATMASMVRDVVHHPDKSGVVLAGVRRVGRAPRRAWRTIVHR